jgi:hypothetical protein
VRWGYHASPQGHTQREIDTFAAAPPAAILWLGGNHEPANGAQYPSAWHLARLPTPAVDESPVQYASAMERIIGPWRAIEGALNALWFIPGNEPEYADKSDVIVAWGVGQWLDAAPGYASALRSLYPGIRLAAPALMAEHTDQLTPGYCGAFDIATCHCYWQIQDEPGIRWHLGGGSYTHALAVAGETVVVTEVGVVSPSGVYADASQMDWDARNAQLATWIGEADAAGVSACCLFVVDASPDFACFDIGPEAAAAIRAGMIPPAPVPVPPPPEPPMGNPYAYDGDYGHDTFRAMMDGPLLAKNPDAASRANYRGCHAAAKGEGISVPTLVGWIKAENVDPALFAVNNLAGIYYVGQSRATPGPLGPASEGSKPYCAFATPEDFWTTLAVNIATVDAAAWARGDLRTIAREYTGGPWGEVKVQLVDALRNTGVYPHGALDRWRRRRAGPPVQHYPLVYPVDAPVAQGSMGTFSHGGASPGFYAIDFACDRGTPCRACADGTVGVIYTGDANPISARTGPSIWIDHDDGYSTFSCHMSRIDVRPGSASRRGRPSASPATRPSTAATREIRPRHPAATRTCTGRCGIPPGTSGSRWRISRRRASSGRGTDRRQLSYPPIYVAIAGEIG